MKRRFLRYSEKKISALPEIGIFWVVEDHERFPKLGFEIFGDTISIKEAKENLIGQKILDSPAEHYRTWNRFRKEWGFPYDEYEEHPRGRVVYNTVTNTYIIICGEQLARKKNILKAVRNYFNLSQQNVKIRKDLHYNMAPTEEELWGDMFKDD